MAHPGIRPSPLEDRVGYFDHDRFRGYLVVHLRSGLQPPCLRFVMLTSHYARLGTRLRARLCRGRHRRRLNFHEPSRRNPAQIRTCAFTHTALTEDGWRQSACRDKDAEDAQLTGVTENCLVLVVALHNLPKPCAHFTRTMMLPGLKL
jgi:hypothetical protein